MSDTGIHVNDIGTTIQLTVMDGTASALNISSATLKQFWFHQPDSTTIVRSASFGSNGSDGILKYNTVSGDIVQPGLWEVQAYIETSSASWHGSRASFSVYENVK
jgi:hypothetical protein